MLKRMNDGLYFLCPFCLNLSYWIDEEYVCIKTIRKIIMPNSKKDELVFNELNKFLGSKCLFCKRLLPLKSDDYKVMIKNGEISPVGEYWQKNKEKLEMI